MGERIWHSRLWKATLQHEINEGMRSKPEKEEDRSSSLFMLQRTEIRVWGGLSGVSFLLRARVSSGRREQRGTDRSVWMFFKQATRGSKAGKKGSSQLHLPAALETTVVETHTLTHLSPSLERDSI